ASTGRLSWLARLYIYSLHGLAIEVCFCAVWYLIERFEVRLHGYSSVWSLPIYGLSLLCMEAQSDWLQSRQVPMPLRGLVYLAWTYAWEFACGSVLKLFGANSWDYTDYANYHIYGLVNFDYAPLWFTSGLLCERYLLVWARSLRWDSG
ncbi:hypothetical protein BOX15_Mlig009306g1, partial [Macrostomum lignano]